MKRQPWCNFMLAGVSLTEYGLVIPAPFVSLELTNSEINSFTSWTLTITIGGDDQKKMNIAGFEALLYTSAQAAAGYSNSSGIPVSFMFGWTEEDGTIQDYTSYQGFTLKFDVSTTGRFLTYKITGYASLALKSSMPVLNIPAVCGMVQPSAVVEGLAHAVKATSYYNLDIDHTDAPTLVSHGAMTTSFASYVRGSYSGKDDYDSFPGLLKLSKTYNSSRDAAGLVSGVKKLSQVLNNAVVTPVSNFLKKSLTDNTPQCSSFSFWVDEPTMTQLGTIHYKSNASLLTSHNTDTLEYGTSRTNILSLNGTYNGVAYSMTNLNFSYTGFAVDGSGNSIVQKSRVVNSWSATISDAFQSVDIINDINALGTQLSSDFTVVVPGTSKQYSLAQPISLIVMSGNTLSPISGIYSIVCVSHNISSTFVTTLKLQRLVMSSANLTATSQGLLMPGSSDFSAGYTPTPNVISTGKVDFGVLYPTYEHIGNY